MGEQRTYTIYASWDPEARVWYVEDSDVPGLATEADTAEELIQKLNVMTPELLRDNADRLPQIPVALVMKRKETLLVNVA